MGTPEDNAYRAARDASRRGWYLVPDDILLAVNPQDSSEVWTFFHAVDLWKRKGEADRCDLRQL